MNKIVKILLLLTLPMFMVAQTGPAAPSSGIWALIDFIQIITGSMKMADGRDLV